MGYNARNDEIRDNVTRMQRQWEAERGALATVRRSFAIMAALTAAGVLFANGALAQEQPLSFKEKLRAMGITNPKAAAQMNYDRAVAKYRKCLAANRSKTSCEGERRIMEFRKPPPK